MTQPRSIWLDPGRTDDERIDALLAEMTLDELVGQLHQSANVDPDSPEDLGLLARGEIGSTLLASGATAGNVRDAGITRERIDSIQRAAATSRLGVPLLVARDVVHGHRTVFPIPLGLAASFDEDLLEQVGARTASETVADGIAWTFAPMVDLVEDARWGRVAESLGESPALTSRLGAALVRGLQSTGTLAACAKHYVGYGLSRGGRDYASVDVGELTLRNGHLRPFRAAVDAGVMTVMAAFSDVDGIPMHSHRHLLRTVLKEEWGFDGVVVADWDGIGELVAHGVAADLREAARLAIDAGVDVDMVSGSYSAHLAELVMSGEVPRTLVEDAARRVLRLKLRLGLFDDGCATLPGGGSDAGSAALGIDRDLAHRAAAESLVVLQGDGLLPIDAATILLTGAYARERASLLGTWVLDGDPAEVTTIAEAVTAAVHERTFPPRLVIDDGAFPDRTLRLAREAGIVVVLVGEHAIRSGEDSALSDLGLPPGQLEVVRALRPVSQRLVVVVVAGRPLAVGEIEDLADVLVWVWHPGTEGGAAIADLLIRGAAAPGRMPMSLPRSAGHTPISHAERPSGRPQGVDARGLGRYQDAAATPVARFGAGSSALTYGALRGPAVVALGGTVDLELDVTNPTPETRRETVLLFFRDEVAEITRPLRELVEVAWVEVAAASTTTLRVTVPVSGFGYVGRDGRFRVDEGRVVLTAGWGRADESSLRVDVVPTAG